ncbi:MAG: hypothetical protein AB7T74_12925 [Clostridia bacterium]
MSEKKTSHPGFAGIFKNSNDSRVCISCCWRLLFLALGLFPGSLSVGSQEIISGSEIEIAVVLERGQDEAQLGLDGIFLDSLSIELELAGFEISNTEDPAILIRVAYLLRETRIEFNLSAEVLADGKILYNESSSEELSFELDTILLEYARQLAGFVKEYADSILPAPGEEVAAEIPDETDTTGVVEPVADPVENPENGSNEESTTVPAGGTGSTEEEKVASGDSQDNIQEVFLLEEAPELGTDWLVLEATAGIFLAGGEAGRYFGGGYTVSTLLGYRFPDHPGFVLGASLGCMYFKLDGYSAEASGLAFLLGPGLRLESGDSSDFISGLTVNAGAALLTVFPENDDPLAKIVPAAEIALTAGIVLEKMTLFVRMGAKTFVEDSSFLYGFAPGIGIEF